MSLPSSLAALAISAPAAPRRGFAGVAAAETVFLRADDEAAMLAAFAAAGIVAAEGKTLPPDFHWPGLGDVSVIGTIYNNDAVIDGAGALVTPATPKAGWHVNILPEG